MINVDVGGGGGKGVDLVWIATVIVAVEVIIETEEVILGKGVGETFVSIAGDVLTTAVGEGQFVGDGDGDGNDTLRGMF